MKWRKENPYVLDEVTRQINGNCRSFVTTFKSKRTVKKVAADGDFTKAGATESGGAPSLELKADDASSTFTADLVLRADKVAETSASMIDSHDFLPRPSAAGAPANPPKDVVLEAASTDLGPRIKTGSEATLRLNKETDPEYDMIFTDDEVTDIDFDCDGTAWNVQGDANNVNSGSLCEQLKDRLTNLPTTAKNDASNQNPNKNHFDIGGITRPAFRVYLVKWTKEADAETKMGTIRVLKKSAKSSIPRCKWQSSKDGESSIANVPDAQLKDTFKNLGSTQVKEHIENACYLEFGCEHVTNAEWATYMGTFGINRCVTRCPHSRPFVFKRKNGLREFYWVRYLSVSSLSDVVVLILLFLVTLLGCLPNATRLLLHSRRTTTAPPLPPSAPLCPALQPSRSLGHYGAWRSGPEWQGRPRAREIFLWVVVNCVDVRRWYSKPCALGHVPDTLADHMHQ